MMRISKYILLPFISLILFVVVQSCSTITTSDTVKIGTISNHNTIKVEAENYIDSSDEYDIIEINDSIAYIDGSSNGWISIKPNIVIAGRYKLELRVSSSLGKLNYIWIEDYFDNKDDRTYNITGNIYCTDSSEQFEIISKDGSPLNTGLHNMKIHFNKGVKIDWIRFTLLKEHEITPVTLKQNTEGEEWKVVWEDNFETHFIDTTKWTYDIGDWGWGNGELQYYTANNLKNARIKDGNLIIEAQKNKADEGWTSARLTTRGKVSFIYGKIEFRAKVPPYKGNWAAGWTLGDEYVDEISWPYCGEIDILESVGFEMDDITGNGIAHASTHCGAYYFKLGNQPTGILEVENMNNQFHTYAVTWLPDGINAYVDNKLYASYNDTSTDLSWPFSKSQNIILNLAIGGGWGGEQGIDTTINSQKMIIDYVKVYELR